MRLTNFTKALNGNPNHANLDFYQNFAASFAYYKYNEACKEMSSEKAASETLMYILGLSREISFDEKETVRLAHKVGSTLATINDLKAMKKEARFQKVAKSGRISKEITKLDEDLSELEVMNYLGCMFLAEVREEKARFREVFFEAVKKEVEALVDVGYSPQPLTTEIEIPIKFY